MDRTFADCLRVGHGYDVHALAPGLRLRLCGVDLEHDRGCVAHSDGDVAVHALCDALLGAAAAIEYYKSHSNPSVNALDAGGLEDE